MHTHAKMTSTITENRGSHFLEGSPPRRAVEPSGPPPLAALLIFIAATAGFSLIAAAVVSHAGITARDIQIDQWLHVHRDPGLVWVMRAVSVLDGIAGTLLMTLVLMLWFWRRRAWTDLKTFVFAIPGVMLLNGLLKQVFCRPRPHLADPLTSLTSYSFPSGHVSQSTVFYGLLATWLLARVARRTGRMAVVGAASMMVCVVAASRLYLGAHYLTDVLAAFLEGVAWLASCRIVLTWRCARPESTEAHR